MRLDFNETNILIQNLRTAEKDMFVNHLIELEKNTKDNILKISITSLKDKILEVSDLRFEEVFDDFKCGKIVSTMEYDI